MPDPGLAELLRRLGSQEPQPAWDAFLETYSGLICEVARWFERDADDAEECFLFICEQLSRKQFKRLRRFDPDGRASFATWLRVVARNLCLDWRRRRFGRYRAFQAVTGLSPFDQGVFRLVCEQGLSAEQCAAALRAEFPSASCGDVEASLQRIHKTLSPRQMWMLDARRRRAKLTDCESVDEAGCSRILVDPSPDPEVQAATAERSDGVQRALEALSPSDRLILLLRFEQELTLAEVARTLGLHDPQTAARRIQEALAQVRETLGVRPAAGGKKLARSV